MSDAERVLTRTERNLWNAIVSEAMAQLKYSAYAHKALEEGHPEVAQVFQEVAGAENIHGINHLRVSGDIRSSMENLRSVVASESKEISARYPSMIKDALDERQMDAAETFTIAMDRERHHIQVFSSALEALEGKLARGEKATAGEGAASSAATTQARGPISVEPELSPTYAAVRRDVEGQRWRVASLVRIREVVFGAQDGLVSTLALVTALAVAAGVDNATVLIGGIAGAFAGMLSMATGTYLGSRAEQDVHKAEIAQEAAELEANPAEEMAELVVLYQREGLSFSEARGVAEHIAADKDLWLRTMVEKELGLSSEMTSSPLKDAFTMGTAFIVAAIIPILPYFFTEGNLGVSTSVAATLVGLLLLGVGTGRIVRKSPVMEGLKILAIGAASAGLGFLLGEVLPGLVT